MIPRNFLVGWVELEKISRLVVLDKTRYLAWGSKEIALKAFEFSKQHLKSSKVYIVLELSPELLIEQLPNLCAIRALVKRNQ